MCIFSFRLIPKNILEHILFVQQIIQKGFFLLKRTKSSANHIAVRAYKIYHFCWHASCTINHDSMSAFTWKTKWTQTCTRFHFDWKSHFCVQSAHYLCSHELKRNKTQNGMDFISIILTEMKFQIGMRFSCEQNLPETKWISVDSLNIAFNAHVRLKLIAGMDFISVVLTEMKFHFW